METGSLLHERYRLQAEIGRGGMAVVYRARDQLLDRDVAIKVVHRTDLGEQDRERLLREARLAARLNHPNIVSVHDAGQVDGTPYIVMELVEGRSLYDGKPDGLEDTIAIASQLCRALAHAHAMGIVHRDLKPENILRTADGAVKLTDFGLALSVASRISRDGIIVGTVYYLAPEQVQGLELDGRTDLYALGVLLYEWTTGALPFGADEALAVITQHLYAPVIPPRAKDPAVPAALDRLIVRLLSKSRDDRPASADEVLEVLSSPQARLAPAEGAAEIPILERIGRGRLAGRASEIQLARGLWARAAAGKSQTLLVKGEPGIGKTRLVQELAALAEVSRGRVLQGWSYAQAAQPFGPIRQMLRAAFEGTAGALASAPEFVLADLLTLAPEFHARFPQITLKPSVDTAEERQRLFESAAVFFSMVSQESPALAVLEDAQWADSATLYLLRYLVQQMGERRVMFVLTYRPVESSQAAALYEVLHDFARENRAHSLALARLDRPQTEEMLASLLGEDVAPGLAQEIYRVTEGNPFFVEEVCKNLAETGGLTVGADGRWQAPARKRLAIPVNVKVAIEGRLHLMPPETQRALEAAAIRGPRFEEEIVRRAAQMGETAVAEALEAAERAKIIEEIPGDGRRFTFTHNLIPATMVEEMPASQRRSLHARMAPVLEALRPEEFEALAHHYRQAGEVIKAADYLLKASERAYALYALPETIEGYTAALDLLQRSGREDEAARTLVRLGLVYSSDFQFDKAQQAYEQAFELWERVWQGEGIPAEGEPPVTLRFAVDEPLTLDPGLAGDDLSTFVIGQLFEGLLEVDEAAGVVPALARRWDVSADGKRYTFHLRTGRRWSDGSPLTAGDFEYAWKRNLALGPSSPAPLLLNVLAHGREFSEGKAPVTDFGVRAVDDRTLEVRLEQPAGYFLLLLTHCATFPLARRAVEGSRQPWTAVENLVGNGPYRLAEWAPGHKMVFERNPFYRGLARGNVARIEAPVIKDYDPVLRMYDDGELDGVSLIRSNPSTIRRLRSAYPTEFAFVPSLSTFFLAFRTDRPPFEARAVRLAFAHAIDRAAYVSETGAVHLRAATGGFLPPGMPGHASSIGLLHDPEAARRLLEEAGYPGGEHFPSVELLYAGDPYSSVSASFLQQTWKETLGVEVRLSGVEWGEFIRRRDEDPPDLSISAWAADYPDPDNMLRVLFHSRDGVNPIRWRNSDFDAQLERASRLTDRKERIELYQAADRILVSEAAVLPLGYAQGRQLVKPYVRLPRTPPYLLRLKHAVVQRPQG